MAYASDPPQATRLQRVLSSPPLLALVLALLIALVAWQVRDATVLKFSPDAFGNVGTVLAPVVMMALFIERASEVLISAWRDPGMQSLQHAVDEAAGDAKTVAQRAMDFYRLQTQRIAFLQSFSLALLTSLVGFRAVQPLLDKGALKPISPHSAQAMWLHGLDMLITALLMAGGADGIHQIITTFTSFLDSTRDRMAAAPGATGQTTAPLPASPVQQHAPAPQQVPGAGGQPAIGAGAPAIAPAAGAQPQPAPAAAAGGAPAPGIPAPDAAVPSEAPAAPATPPFDHNAAG